MVSQDFPKESAPSINLRQCLVSSVDTCSVRSEGFDYVLPCFGTGDAEVVTRHLVDRRLSLTLGSRMSSGQYSRNEYNETVGRVNDTMNNQCRGMGLSVVQNSAYLKPAKALLEEVVRVGNAVEPSSDSQGRESTLRRGGTGEEGNALSGEEHEVSMRITKLASLLNQLDNRCKSYFHEMDGIVSSFETVAGKGAAASYTALMIQAMSKYFSNLRDAIVAQLNASRNSLSEDLPRNQGETPHGELMKRKKRRTLQREIHIPPVWMPSRGLPEDSVTLLRTWLFKHFLHPYPDENEKRMLVSQTGLTRNQISNWFINARVRFWKPMIEEMYREEFAEDMQESNPSSEL